MSYSPESLSHLGSCHPDLVQVFIQADLCVEIDIVEGGISINEAQTSGRLGSEQLHWPSDALCAAPTNGSLPGGLDIDELSTAIRKSVMQYCHDMAEWWYLGGVVTGVAQTLYDRGAIESPIEWMGELDLTRYRRKSDTNG